MWGLASVRKIPCRGRELSALIERLEAELLAVIQHADMLAQARARAWMHVHAQTCTRASCTRVYMHPLSLARTTHLHARTHARACAPHRCSSHAHARTSANIPGHQLSRTTLTRVAAGDDSQPNVQRRNPGGGCVWPGESSPWAAIEDGRTKPCACRPSARRARSTRSLASCCEVWTAHARPIQPQPEPAQPVNCRLVPPLLAAAMRTTARACSSVKAAGMRLRRLHTPARSRRNLLSARRPLRRR
jgi:hypothetical protein